MFHFTQPLQSRLVKFVLKRVIGVYLKNELDLGQLDVQLGRGSLELKDLELNCKVLNSMLEDLPFRIQAGSVGSVVIHVPWQNLWNQNCSLRIKNLELTIVSKSTPMPDASVILEAAISGAAAASTHIVEEFLSGEVTEVQDVMIGDDDYDCDADGNIRSANRTSQPGAVIADASGMEGLQVLSQLIENILSKIQVHAENVVVHLQHTPPNKPTVMLTLRLPEVKFEDDTPSDTAGPGSAGMVGVLKGDTTEQTKKVNFRNWRVEIQHELRPGEMAGSPQGSSSGVDAAWSPRGPLSPQSMMSTTTTTTLNDDMFLSARGSMMGGSMLAGSMLNSVLPPRGDHPDGRGFSPPVIVIAGHPSPDKTDFVELKIRTPVKGATGKVEVDATIFLRALHARLTSAQYYTLMEFLDAFMPGAPPPHAPDAPWQAGPSSATGIANAVSAAQPLRPDDYRTIDALKQGRRVHDGFAPPSSMSGRSSDGESEDETQFHEYAEVPRPSTSAPKQPAPAAAPEVDSTSFFKLQIADLSILLVHDDISEAALSDDLTRLPRFHHVRVSGQNVVAFVLSEAAKTTIKLKVMQMSMIDKTADGDETPLLVGGSLGNEAVRAEIVNTGGRAPVTAVTVDLGQVAVYFSLVAFHAIGQFFTPPVVPSAHADMTQTMYHSVVRQAAPAGAGAAGVGSAILNEMGREPQETQPKEIRVTLTSPQVHFVLLLPRAKMHSKPGDPPRHAERLVLDIGGLSFATTLVDGKVGMVLRLSMNELVGYIDYGSNVPSPVPGRSNQPPRRASPDASDSRVQFIRAAAAEGSPAGPHIEITVRDPALVASGPAERIDPRSGATRANRTTQFSSFLAAFLDGSRRTVSPTTAESVHIQSDAVKGALYSAEVFFPVAELTLSKRDLDVLQERLLEFVDVGGELPGAPVEPEVTDFAPAHEVLSSPESSDAEDDAPRGPVDMMTQSMMSVANTEVETGARERIETPVPSLFALVLRIGVATVTLTEQLTDMPLPAGMAPQPTNLKIFQLGLRDLCLFQVAKYRGAPVSYLTVHAAGLDLSETLVEGGEVLVDLRKSSVCPSRRDMGALAVSFLQNNDPTARMQEGILTVDLSALDVYYRVGADWLFRLIDFFATTLPWRDLTPVVRPNNSLYNLYINALDCTIQYVPRYISSVLVLSLGNVRVSCNIVPESTRFSISVLFRDAVAYLHDDVELLGGEPDDCMHASMRDHLMSLGFVDVLTAASLDLFVVTDKVLKPAFQLTLSNVRLELNACADSFYTFVEVVQYYFGSKDLVDPSAPVIAPPKPAPTERPPPATRFGEDAVGNMAAAMNDDDGGMQAARQEKRQSADANELIPMIEDFYEQQQQRRPAERRPAVAFAAEPVDEHEESLMFQNNPMTDSVKRVPPPEAEVIVRTAASEAPTERITVFLAADEVLVFDDNHFSLPDVLEVDGVKAPSNLPPSVDQYILRDVNLVIRFYDGYDWGDQPAAGAPPPPDRELDDVRHSARPAAIGSAASALAQRGSQPGTPATTRAEPQPPEPLVGEEVESDAGAPAGPAVAPAEPARTYTPADIAQRRREGRRNLIRAANRPGRRSTDCMEAIVERLTFSIDVFPTDTQYSSRMALTVGDFEVRDCLERSNWNKFLCYLERDHVPRLKDAPMLRFVKDNVRPTPSLPAEELRVTIALLPIRLNIDEDALIFLEDFFGYLPVGAEAPPPPPPPTRGQGRAPGDEEVTFIQRCEIMPLTVRVDYKQKHFKYASLREGDYRQLLGLLGMQLRDAELRLNRVALRSLHGWGAVTDAAVNAWLPGIYQQIPSMVGALGPLRPFVNVGAAAADLFTMPLEQYRRDGRLLRGLHRGASSFVRTSAVEVLTLGSRVAAGATGVIDALSAYVADPPLEHASSRHRNQPRSVTDGAQLFVDRLRGGFLDAHRHLVTVPYEAYQQGGTTDMIRAAVRAAPAAMLSPLAGAFGAVGAVFTGARNALDPARARDWDTKYKTVPPKTPDWAAKEKGPDPNAN